MNLKRITIEQFLYLIILILAIGVRILGLNEVPLSDDEAARAMQALQVSRGESPEFSPGPAYPLLTGLTFFLFSDTNAYARFWPLIAGCCLVFFPYLIRSLIGRKAALIMAFGLAINPTLVAVSRVAGTEIMVAGFTFLAVGSMSTRRSTLAGIFAGLALLSGPSALYVLLGLVLTWLIGGLLTRMKVFDMSDNALLQFETGSKAMYPALLAAGVIIITVGTLFFLFPGGLGSLTSIIPGYFQEWVTTPTTSIAKLLISLVVYNPIALIFGILSVIQSWRHRDWIGQWLSIMVVIFTLLGIIYPGRDGFTWIWLLVPLWALAAIEIARYFRLREAEYLPALGQTLLIFLLMALGWLNLAGLGSVAGVAEGNQLRWAIIAGTIVLGGITTLLVGLGWSARTAQQGLAWGILMGLGIYGVSLMWGVSQLRPSGEQDLLRSFPQTLNTGDFQETLVDLSEWRTGIRNSLDVVVTSSSPSLMWEMRSWPNARFLPTVPVGELPSIIVNQDDQPSPNLSAGYRGQDFGWWSSPGWEGPLPENWPRWLVFRDAPSITSNIILWARGDLFPGGVIGEISETGTEGEEDRAPIDLPVE